MDKNIVYKTAGKLAKAVIVQEADNSRIAHITFSSGAKLHVPTDHINLRAMKAEDAADALDKACHASGRVSCYEVTEVTGGEALTRAYSSTLKGQETGYGLFIKRGEPVRKFALSRINLGAMKAKNAVEALRKAAFTGRLALIPAKSAVAQG